MMLAYHIWTWTAISLLAFGSITVFAVFLVMAFRQLRAEKHLDATTRPQ